MSSSTTQPDMYQQLRAVVDGPTNHTSNANANHTDGLRRVEVNQRALIDKILARYATQNAVYRELLQNSNDAGATHAQIQFTTSRGSTSAAAAVVTQVVYRNNGMAFRPQDWDRLQKIAEGNPDVSKVGAFGVGAYTMFSITEEPVIVSGGQCLLFTWRGDALYTKSTAVHQKNTASDDPWTTFCLPSRDPYPLPDWQDFGEFLTAALTFTAALRTITVSVDGTERLRIAKTILQPPRLVQTPKRPRASFFNLTVGGSSNGNLVTQSPGGLFVLQADSVHESVVRVTVTVASVEKGHPSPVARTDARYVSATAQTKIPSDMAKRMQRVTKKQPPPTVTVQAFLNYDAATTSAAATSKARLTTTTTTPTLADRIAQSFAPVQGKGRIFIGFRTSQTTGLGAHLQAPFVPTVEREAMDLQDAVLARFNSELLEFGGILLRLTLEHTMRNVIDVAWQDGREARETLEAKLLRELAETNETAATASKATANQEADESNGDNEADAENDDDAATASSATLMGFARYMARGVKKKIVSVAKSVEGLIEGDGSQRLLYPPDPLPLSPEETQAIVLMGSFCPIQSTPDPFVGTLLAQGFSRCMPKSAPPVLTKSGVVPGNEARLPHYGIEGFVSENVIRTVVFNNAEEYHTVIARCRKLNFEDLMTVVSDTVLDQEKAVLLVQWWSRFCKTVGTHRTAPMGSRLKEAIRFKPNGENVVKGSKEGDSIVQMQDLLFFVARDSPFSRRDLPLPETVLPAYLQELIGLSVLMSEPTFDIWFSPLPMEIWSDFVSYHSSMVDAKPEDELMRVKVLTTLSGEYMRRYSSDRSVFGGFCRGLLSDKRCIPFDSDMPSNLAADRPSELYLYSAELNAFSGIGSFHKVSGSIHDAGVTDEFLLELGVRKSVSINFLFANLDKLSFSKDPRSLVEYLITATLTRSDMNQLRDTKYLPAAGDTSRRYAPAELYLPNDDLVVFPFAKTLHWPSESTVSEKSSSGAFLVKLGMRTLPSLGEALSFCSGNTAKESQRIKAIDFVCDRLVPHGAYYGQYNAMGPSARKLLRFLPCIRKDVIESDVASSERQSPVSCFIEPKCAIMGFPVIDPKLGKTGKVYGSLFQCESEPPASHLLSQLKHLVACGKSKLNDRSESTKTGLRIVHLFDEIFKYLSQRTANLQYSSIAALQKESFIPCQIDEQIVWHRPDEIFFKRSDRTSDSLTDDLFHVIEFNPFLAAAGVKEEATTKEIFAKILKSPKTVLQTLGSEKKYRGLLRRIAANPPFDVSRPSQEIKESPFLLAYSIKESGEKKTEKAGDDFSYELRKAADIYVVDNANYARMFPVHRAPPETDLEDFYTALGSQYISKATKRRFEVVGTPRFDTELCLALRSKLSERGPLLVSPNVTSRPLVPGAAALLDDNRLDFCECTNLLAVYTLGKFSRRNRTTCFSRPSKDQKNTIFVTEDFDLFDAGQAIGDMILKRCQLEDAFFISSLLETPLDQLRARGFPIDRILKPAPVVHDKVEPSMVSQTSVAPATSNIESVSQPNGYASNNTSLTQPSSKAHDHQDEPSDSSDTGTKADIINQMFPDADPNFIVAALGKDPSLDNIKKLANEMSSGHYPRKEQSSDNSTVASSTASSRGSFDNSSTVKKKSLRKRLGKAFGGQKGSATSANQPLQKRSGKGQSASPVNETAGVTSGVSNNRTESREPVAPAVDVRTQNSLESMLENSVGNASTVRHNDIDSPETRLESIPPNLDRGNTCEIIPGHSLKPFVGPRGNGCTHNGGLQVFSSKTHASSETFLEENEVSLHFFAEVLQRLCVNVFGLDLKAVAIYHDPAGLSIAFNRGRALHMNFRFFHALHFLQNKHESSECYSYWFVTICHELAHNFVSGHTREHGFYTESFAGKYLPKLTALLNEHNLT